MTLDTGAELVAGAIAIMSADLSRHVEIREIAEDLHYSQFHFQRVFRDRTGITPGRYLAALRIQRAKVLLAGTSLPIVQVALDVGYQSHGTFTTQFTRQVGLPPARFRTLVDRVAGRRLSEVVTGPIEPHDGPPARISAPADPYRGERVTLLGVFDAPIPRGAPAAFSLTTSDHPTMILPVKSGLPVLAASYPGHSQLTDMLLNEPAVLVGHSRSTRRPAADAVPREVVLRPLIEGDPPILTAVHVMYLVGQKRVFVSSNDGSPTKGNVKPRV